LIRTLAGGFAVSYAAKTPGPSDLDDLSWIPLRGGRLRRWFHAFVLTLRGGWDVLVLHDPETIPIGIFARALRRRPVVFDVHENIPATALTRPWVPLLFRKPLEMSAGWILRLAERTLTLTLAEPGYQSLFRNEHVVFPNYPDTSDYPDPISVGSGEVVHLGDATLVRGVDVGIEACGKAGMPLRLIGRVADDMREELLAHAESHGAALHFDGVKPNREALELVAKASVAIVPWKDLPNYRDSFPTKLLEYLAVGVPTVASDLPGTSGVAAGLPGLTLVPVGDPETLAKAIRDSVALREMAADNAGAVRESFKWPSEDVLAFYLSLV
jgi:glycosyltransferase involved in cell wall biosynthesis